MKKLLSMLRVACGRVARRGTSHDDTLRANQGERAAAFSFWRALVS